VQQIPVTMAAALSESAAAMTGQAGNSPAHMPAIDSFSAVEMIFDWKKSSM
jgi:hypothetical protein